MSFIQSLLDFLRALLSWWFIVEPWEQAVRVRLGNRVKLFGPGTHLKVPFFDALYKQNVRRRVSGIPLQTLTTSDGIALTIHGSIGYKIADVLKLQMTLHDAEESVRQEVLGRVTTYVVNTPSVDCTPAKIIANVTSKLDFGKYGLAEVEFFLNGYVSNVPTYRLIQDSMAPYMQSSLSTCNAVSPGAPR